MPRDTSRGRHSGRIAWLVYLACLRSHVLCAYCNFESKQAISITLFGRRPNRVIEELAFLDKRNINLRKLQNLHFSKGVSPWFWSKYLNIFFFSFLSK